MPDSLTFTVDVFRTIGDRLRSKAVDLQVLAESRFPLEDWFRAESFLACRQQQEHYPFCEVETRPSYASEGVSAEPGELGRDCGDLRVGGPNAGADHCWLFAEIVPVSGNPSEPRMEAAIGRLQRLGWKKSAALLIVVAASPDDTPPNWAGSPLEFRTQLVEPVVISFPAGGSVVVSAFDIKTNPVDTLTMGKC